jgi:hypothetical protein
MGRKRMADLFRAPLRKKRARHHRPTFKESSNSIRNFWNGGTAKETSSKD